MKEQSPAQHGLEDNLQPGLPEQGPGADFFFFFKGVSILLHARGEVVSAASIGEHLCEGVRLCLIGFKDSVPHPKVEIGGTVTVLLFDLFNLFIHVAQVNPIVQISYPIFPMSHWILPEL